MIRVTYNRGDTPNVLVRLHRETINRRPLLRSLSVEVINSIDRNFQRQQSPMGIAWRPLALSTQRQRARLGYGAQAPILQRTGKLRKSFRAVWDNNRLTVGSRVPYAKYLQPIRPMVGPSPMLNARLAQRTVEFYQGVTRRRGR